MGVDSDITITIETDKRIDMKMATDCYGGFRPQLFKFENFAQLYVARGEDVAAVTYDKRGKIQHSKNKIIKGKLPNGSVRTLYNKTPKRCKIPAKSGERYALITLWNGRDIPNPCAPLNLAKKTKLSKKYYPQSAGYPQVKQIVDNDFDILNEASFDGSKGSKLVIKMNVEYEKVFSKQKMFRPIFLLEKTTKGCGEGTVKIYSKRIRQKRKRNFGEIGITIKSFAECHVGAYALSYYDGTDISSVQFYLKTQKPPMAPIRCPTGFDEIQGDPVTSNQMRHTAENCSNHGKRCHNKSTNKYMCKCEDDWFG